MSARPEIPVGSRTSIGRVISLHRYPVKSMAGEDVEAADITPRGLLGDRAYAFVDTETGRVVSAKRPRMWEGILDYVASFEEPPSPACPTPPVRIEMPGGAAGSSTDQADLDARASVALGRPVGLRSVPPEGAGFQYHWPDMEGLEYQGRVYRDEITEHAMPPGTFFDSCALNLLTTASLARLAEQAPSSLIEARRFRPNVLIGPTDGEAGFVENDWVGRRLRIGREVEVEITLPCLRCVMVNLAQRGLPADPEVLKTVFAHNAGNLGVKAAVTHPGRIEVGDSVWLE